LLAQNDVLTIERLREGEVNEIEKTYAEEDFDSRLHCRGVSFCFGLQQQKSSDRAGSDAIPGGDGANDSANKRANGCAHASTNSDTHAGADGDTYA
jgi:hypothetical protein